MLINAGQIPSDKRDRYYLAMEQVQIYQRKWLSVFHERKTQYTDRLRFIRFAKNFVCPLTAFGAFFGICRDKIDKILYGKVLANDFSPSYFDFVQRNVKDLRRQYVLHMVSKFTLGTGIIPDLSILNLTLSEKNSLLPLVEACRVANQLSPTTDVPFSLFGLKQPRFSLPEWDYFGVREGSFESGINNDFMVSVEGWPYFSHDHDTEENSKWFDFELFEKEDSERSSDASE
jgi:hypothetical protein